jgi:hypothetical protein
MRLLVCRLDYLPYAIYVFSFSSSNLSSAQQATRHSYSGVDAAQCMDAEETASAMGTNNACLTRDLTPKYAAVHHARHETKSIRGACLPERMQKNSTTKR